ncbi:MAG: hypothetical protein KIT57_12595 [Blastocatellales bacterium]|nr:hypothetical protein [Blastocatellales bacterium]
MSLKTLAARKRKTLSGKILSGIAAPGAPIRIVIAMIPALLIIGAGISYRPILALIGVRTDTTLPAQSPITLHAPLSSRLALEPAAERLARRLGRRFLASGREASLFVGTLVVEGEAMPIRVMRRQNDDGEDLSIALNGDQALLVWDDKLGARSRGAKAGGLERKVIERLALDSPEQFVYAQIRGASYDILARDVRPESAGGADGYAGPLWNLIRLEESADESREKPLSRWRVYHINTTTGLIDQISSQEDGQVIIAELAGWTLSDGEFAPARITWKRDGKTIMDLSLTNIVFGPRQ